MNFTPGQVQEMLQISPATFRHWKRALPPLGDRNGYTPCFSPGDLVAMALLKTLTEGVGIRASSLELASVALFEQCNRNSWASLERSVLIVEPLSGTVSAVSETQGHIPNVLVIAVPCRSTITNLRERLLLGHEEPRQEPLRFPPTAVGRTSGGRAS